MKIKPNQKFIHKGEVFEKGEEYDVADEDAHYFTAVGWVGEPSGGSPATLNVHSGTHGQTSEVEN